MKTETVKLSQIEVNSANPRIISDDKFTKLVNSILALPKMLELRPIVVDNTMVALGGNMRYRALMAIADMQPEEMKERLSGIRDFQKKTAHEQTALIEYWERWQDNPTAPILKASELTEDEQREFIIKDNVGFGEWDMDALANEWDADDLNDWGVDVWNDTGAGGSDDSTGAGGSDIPKSEGNSLNDTFIIPPFSILDSRQGYWQARKKMWRGVIGDMGQSRQGKLIQSIEMQYKDLYTRTAEHRKTLGISFREYLDKYVPEEVKQHESQKVPSTGVSLFDPVLAEILCKWFTPYKGAKIFDCFAGDTQKGLVFGTCGYEFKGVELRQEQVDINNEVIADRGLPISYVCDDGQNVANHFEPESQDLLFSCPPYFDLEVYSDLPNDASNQGTYEEFIAILDNAFKAAFGCLKKNRFAVVVLGDVRSKKDGSYYDFGGDVKRIFREAGAHLYNELILIEVSSSVALRAKKYMESRKVAKMHQNILVFYKGDPAKVRNEFAPIEITEDEQKALQEIIDNYQPKEEDAAPLSDDGTQPSQEKDEWDDLLSEINHFRTPYMSKGLVAYERYPHIKECLKDGDIHIERDEQTGEIIGYLWMQDLKKKPLSRIYEIISNRKGLGRKLIEKAIAIKKQPTLQLYVLDYNTNAIEFYKHMGFVEVERETGQPKGKNNITMEYRGNAVSE